MSLDSTKKRISSVKTTSKITNAMKLVASSKIAKQKAVYLKIKDYYEEYYDIVGKIVSLSPEFAKTSENQKALYIVITSTLGLCGGYNSSVAKACLAEMKENDFVLSTNNFYSDEMKQYNNLSIDDWKSNERYQVAYSALQQNKNRLSLNLAKNILCGKYGFMCQYDRKKDADTVWSVIYDTRNKKIYRAEGNPSRRAFKEDCRFKESVI